jgi:hypothetical protein
MKLNMIAVRPNLVATRGQNMVDIISMVCITGNFALVVVAVCDGVASL